MAPSVDGLDCRAEPLEQERRGIFGLQLDGECKSPGLEQVEADDLGTVLPRKLADTFRLALGFRERDLRLSELLLCTT